MLWDLFLSVILDRRRCEARRSLRHDLEVILSWVLDGTRGDGAVKREGRGRFPQPPPSTAGYRLWPTLVEEPLVSLFKILLLLVEISTEVSFVSLDSRPPPFRR